MFGIMMNDWVCDERCVSLKNDGQCDEWWGM